MRATMSPNPVGEVLREWRDRRRFSQMALAHEVGVSPRHLSFIETGRTSPSPQVLLALARGLDMPLRDRNTLLLAAGYAPRYTRRGLDDAEMAPVLASVNRLLEAHDPLPGVAVDRSWNVVAANPAASTLMAGAAPALLSPPVNVYRLTLHPDGMAPRIRNFQQWATHLLAQLRRDARTTGDDRLRELYEEVAAYPNVRSLDLARQAVTPEVLLPVRFDSDLGELSLFTTLTTFGTPQDVTVQELLVELFFPADEATRRRLSRSDSSVSQGAHAPFDPNSPPSGPAGSSGGSDS